MPDKGLQTGMTMFAQRLIVMTLLVFPAISITAQDYDLRLHLQPGKVYWMTTHMSMNMSHTVSPGIDIHKSGDFTSQTSYTVDLATDTAYHITARYEDQNMTVTMMGQSTTSSSTTTDTNDITGIIMREMKNHPFKLSLSPKGYVLWISGSTDWMEATKAKIKRLEDAEMATYLYQMQQAYGEDAFKSNLEMVSRIFPEDAVQKNDQWNGSRTAAANMQVNIQTKYTLEEIDSNSVTITGVSTISTDTDPPFIETLVGKLKYKLTGPIQSTIVIDRESGWLKSLDQVQKMSGEMITQLDMMDNEEITIDINLTNTIRSTGSEREQ